MKCRKLLALAAAALLMLMPALPGLGEGIQRTPWRDYTQTRSTADLAEWRIIYEDPACTGCTITASAGELFFAPTTDCTIIWHAETRTAALHWDQHKVEWLMCCYPAGNGPETILFTYHAADGSVIHQDTVELFPTADGSWCAVMQGISRNGIHQPDSIDP